MEAEIGLAKPMQKGIRCLFGHSAYSSMGDVRASFVQVMRTCENPVSTHPLWYQMFIDLGMDIRCLKVKDSRKDRYSAPVCAKQCENQSANKAHDKPEYHAVPPPHDHTSAADTARRRAPRPETVGLSQHACKLR